MRMIKQSDKHIHHVGVPSRAFVAMRCIIKRCHTTAASNNLEKSYYPSMPGIFLGLVGVKISVTAIVLSISPT